MIIMIIRINKATLHKLPQDLILSEIHALFSVSGDRLRYTSIHSATVARTLEEIEFTNQIRKDLSWFASVNEGDIPDDIISKVTVR